MRRAEFRNQVFRRDGFAVFEEGDGFGPKACLLEEADEAV